MPPTSKNLDEAVDVRNLFKRHFGYAPAFVVKAPGCIELLGDFADDHEGIALTAAVDRCVFVSAAPRTDGKIEWVTSGVPSRELFWLTDLKPNPAAPWADTAKDVLGRLRRRRVHFSGFNAAIHSTIPSGIGIGGSAALQVAVALAVRKLFPFSLTEAGVTVPPRRDERGHLPPLARAERFHLAKLCHDIETRSVGERGGLAELLTTVLGKAWSLLSVDCRFSSVDPTPLVGEALVICDTGARDTGMDWESEVRAQCKAAAVKLQAKTLRSVEPKLLAANRDKLTAREYECAAHVVGEIQRVAAAERALREDDHRQLGQYLFQGHDSARDFLKHNLPEADLLVELARAHPGCLGARRLGQCDTAATVSLVSYHQAEDFMKVIARRFEERAGRKVTTRVCQIVDGAE